MIHKRSFFIRFFLLTIAVAGFVQACFDKPECDGTCGSIPLRRSSSTGDLPGRTKPPVVHATPPLGPQKQSDPEIIARLEAELARTKVLVKQEARRRKNLEKTGCLASVAEIGFRELRKQSFSSGSSVTLGDGSDSDDDDSDSTDPDDQEGLVLPEAVCPGSPVGRRRTMQVIPASPCPVHDDEIVEPGIFASLQAGEHDPTVLFDFDGLFCFVGLLSDTYQATVATPGSTEWGFASRLSPAAAAVAVAEAMSVGSGKATAAVKFAVQLTCALDPCDEGNRVASWDRVRPANHKKARFLFKIIHFVLIKIGALSPEVHNYGTRTWDNSGAPFQTVSWPHTNWAVSDALLPLVKVKEVLKNPKTKQIIEGFYAYCASRSCVDEVLSVAMSGINSYWTAFKIARPDLFVRAGGSSPTEELWES